MVHPARKSSNYNNWALVLHLRICKPITHCKSLKLHHSCMDPPPGNLQNVATVCQSKIDVNPMHSNIKRKESVVGQFDHARGLKRSATSWWFFAKADQRAKHLEFHFETKDLLAVSSSTPKAPSLNKARRSSLILQRCMRRLSTANNCSWLDFKSSRKR